MLGSAEPDHGRRLTALETRELFMSPKNPKRPLHASSADTTEAVDAFMNRLQHPFKAEIQAIRSAILGADPSIAEGIKWSAPSFRTTEYFATTNLREKAGIGVIFHLGAKVRDTGPGGIVLQDPEQLLKWLAKDRAMIVFKDQQDFVAKKAAFEGIVRSWLAYV